MIEILFHLGMKLAETVIRGVERYRGRLIAYSLGNFVGYHTLGAGGVLADSGILRVTLGSGGRVLAGRWNLRLEGNVVWASRDQFHWR